MDKASIYIDLRDQSSQVRQWAQDHGFAVSAIFEGLWAILLSYHSGSDSASFRISQQNANGALVEDCNVELNDNIPFDNFTRSLQKTVSAGSRPQGDGPAPTALQETQIYLCSEPVDLTRVDEDGALVNIILENGPRGLLVDFRYAIATLGNDEAQRLVGSLKQGLNQVLNNASIPIDDIDFVSEDQYTHIVKSNSPYPDTHCRSAHELISIRAASQPSAEAICSTEVNLTYQRLEELSSSFAQVLVEAGVGPEVVVPLCSHKSPWAILAMLSVVKAGGAYTVIPPDSPPARVQHIMDIVDATVVLATPETASKFNSIKTFVISADFFYSLAKAPAFAKFGRVKPNNAFCVIFTSGSTGQPKAITVEHRNHVTSSRATAKYFGWSPQTRIFQYSAFNWDVSVRDIFGGLMAGACLCVPTDMERLDALAATITGFRANFLGTTPTVLRLLSPDDVPTFQTIGSIGEKLTDDLTNTWSDRVRFINDYGPAEITVSSSMRDVDTAKYSSANIGPRLSSCLHWVTNPRNPNTLVPIGAVGELVVQGPTVTRGYRKDPKKTAAAYTQNLLWQKKLGYTDDQQRIYRTGDMVRLMADGSFEYIGRRDTQIKINGQRTEISEIENQLISATPTPLQISVSMVSSSDRPEKKILAAFIETPQDGPVSKAGSGVLLASKEMSKLAATIRSTVVERLPAFMIPTHYIPVAYTPRSHSGKLDRSLLDQWARRLSWKDLSTYAGTSSEKLQASTTTEKSLRQLWASVLNIDDVASIGANDHFFQLGGDSIAAIRLSRAAQEQGIVLTSKNILENPTLSAMAAVINPDDIACIAHVEMPKPFSLVDASFVVPVTMASIAESLQVAVESIEDAYPCTALQGDLMASTMIDSAAYISQQVFKLPDTLDLNRFQAAWDRVYTSTPILRTRIQSAVVAGRPRLIQLVIDEKILWQFGADLQAYLENDKKVGMTVGQQLCRFALIRSANSHYFVWTAHHAIYDGWSLELLLDDVSGLYHGAAPVTHPNVNTFVKHLESQDPKLCQRFWQTYLEGYETSEFLQLPSSKSSALATRTVNHTIKAVPVTSAHVTSSAMLRVAWAMVLEQYTGSSDVLFGCTQSGRTIDGVDADLLVAPMFATVPVRVKYNQTQSVKSVLTEAQNAANEMLPYEHVGLQNLRQYGDACRQASEFQTILIVQAPTSDIPFPFQDQQKLEGDELLTYALSIECTPRQGLLCVEGHFDPEIIDESTVRRMLLQFESVVSQIAIAGDVTVADLDTLSTQDKQCLETFNDNGAECVDACVHQVIRQRTFLTPNAPAMKDDTIELTYQQLDTISQRLASHLVSIGIGPEVIVPLCIEKSVWSAVSMLAVLRAGGACVALDPALPDGRLTDIIKTTAARKLLVSSAQKHRFSSSEFDITVVDQRSIEALPTHAIPSRVSVRPNNAAFIVFTSGSTGKPKGIVLEHRNVCSTAQTMHNVQFLNSSSRVLQFSSYTFDVYIEEIFITLMWGGCVCIPTEDQRRNDLAGFINRMGVNWMDVTPTLMGMLHPDEVPSLKTLVCGGEKLPQHIVDRWVERTNVVYTYGPAECSVICTSMKAPMSRNAEVTNVGHPMGGSIWITHQDDPNRLMPVGCVGELLVEGPIVAREYLNDAAATSRSFITNPNWAKQADSIRRFYRTGDLARYNEDGSICIIGRKDSQIKIHGQRVELGDIEYAITQLAAEGSHVVVEAIPDSAESGQKQLVAFVTYPGRATETRQAKYLDLSDDLRDSLSEIQEKLSKKLPQHMIPQLFIPVASLPETPSGKTDRKTLRETGRSLTQTERLQFSLVTASKRQPSSTQEEILKSLWSAVLNLDESSVGIDDKFFQLGGSSISAMHLASAARALGFQIVVRDVFEHPRLCDLAKRMTTIDATSQISPIKDVPITPLPTKRLPVVEIPVVTAPVLVSPIEESPVLPSPSSQYESVIDENEKREYVLEEVRIQLNCASSLIEDVYLCTPLQQNLMASTVRDHSSYVLREIFKIPSGVDLARFQEAWEIVRSNYAILRTRIMPVVTSAESIETYQVVLNEAAEWEQGSCLHHFIEKDRALGMEYGKPLCRFAIISQPQDSAYFVFTLHHAIYDGWSLPLMYSAVSDVYNGLELSPSVSFKKFVDYVQDIDQEQSATFWKTHLLDCVPTQYPPITQKGQEVHATETFVQEFEHQYDQRKSDVTLPIVLQAAWAILLSKFTDSQDVVFGSINAGRNADLAGIEIMVGPTIATVPLRVKFNKQESIRHFLRRLQTQSLDVAEHEHLGLDRIARVSTDARKATQFQNLFIVQPGDDEGSDEPELLNFSKIETPLEDFMSFPLSMQCTLGAKFVTTTANYDPDVLDVTDIDRILDQFAHVAQQLVRAGNFTKVADIDLLSSSDLAQLQDWNDYEPEAVVRSIPDVIADWVRLQPDAEAVCGWDGSLSYSELDDLSNRLAQYLLNTFNVRANERIPFCTQKSVWTVVAMLAILKVGGSTIALDPSFPVARTSAILGATRARFVITQSEYERKFISMKRKALVIDEAMIKNLPLARRSNLPLVQPTAAACILFSSGTTGTPKGIILEHQAIASASRQHGSFSGVKPGTRVLQFAAYTFDVSIQDVLMTLQNGGCICVPSESQRLDDIASAINTMQVNWTFLTPTVAKLLEPADVPCLKTLVLGGEALPAEHLATWSHAVTLFNGYGPAEAGTVCAIRKTNDSLHLESSNVGRSLKSIRCWVTNADDPEQLLPIGAVGELLVEGPSLALSYLNDPVKTSAVFIEAPLWAKKRTVTRMHNWRFYRTGDLVRQLSDGSFTYLGRKDMQVKLHGQRLDLDDVEQQIKAAFGAECRIVVDVVQPAHRAGSDLLTAFVCLSKTNGKTDSQLPLVAEVSNSYIEKIKDVKMLLSNRLPIHAIPALWVPVTRMPTSLSQKLDRKALKSAASSLSAEELAQCSFSNAKKRAPVSDLEMSLASLWANLLKMSVSFIGLDDSFLEIGGDSITAMKLVALARKNKIHLSMDTIFSHPRLAEMAAAAGKMGKLQSTKGPLSALLPFSLVNLSQGDLATYIDSLATEYNLTSSHIADIYPCTPMQEGLFALTMSDASLYMAQFAFEIDSNIDVELLMNAWNEVVQQLPVLRTTIVPAPAHIQNRCNSCQVVLEKSSTWQRYRGNDVQQYLQAEMPKQVGYGAELAKFAIIEGDKRYFAVTVHHALYDGWSLPMIFSLLEQIYFASPTARVVPYNLFVRSLLDLKQEDLAEFWTDYLMGYTSTGFPKLPNPKYVPTIDGQLEKQINLKASKLNGVMPATLIQTAWSMVLGAHSSTEDVVFLSTQIGRSSDLDGIEEIIGCTVTTVPVRFVMNGTQQLGSYLRDAQDRSNKMTKFEHYGLRNIQRIGSEQRMACQAGCLMVIQPQPEKTDSKLGLIPLNSDDTQMLSYPLVVECNLGTDSVNVRFGFDTNLLSEETMGRVIEQFASVLQQLSSMKETTLMADVEILSPSELNMLRQWNSKPPKYQNETIQECFKRAVARWPQRLAVDAHDARLSFTELDRLSTNLAHYLLSLGLKRQQIIPLMFEKSAWTVVSMLAVAKAACTFVLFDPSVPMQRCLDISKEVGARVVLASRDSTKNWINHYKVFTVDAVNLSTLPDADPNFVVPCAPTDLFYLIFTSGSTGKPKGCMTEHGSFLSVLQGQRDASDFGINDRMLQFASYSFDISLLEVFSSLMLGARLCIPTQHDCSTDVGKVLRDWKITWSYITPSLARAIDPDSVPHLRALALVGEQVMPIDVEKWATKLSLINGYGPSESVAAASYIGVKLDGEPSNIGLPMGCVCWVVDPDDHDRLVPIGTVGELVIDGPIVSPGYYKNPEKTAEAFISSTKWLEGITGRKTTRMYKTGDLAKANADRTITFVGRKDTQVKIRGQRMELGEPEHHLLEDSLVHSAVVLKGQKGGPLDSQLVAILSLRAQTHTSSARKGAVQWLAASEELLNHVTHLTNVLEKKMPLYMVPTTWIFLEKMPLLPAGKIDRKRLQGWIHDIDDDVLQQCVGSTGSSEGDENLSSDLINLREAVGQALNMPISKVKLNRSFLAQGGDSISAMQVHSRLRKMRLNVDFKDIVTANTLVELSQSLQAFDSTEQTLDVPAEQGDQPFALTPMQSWYAEYALKDDHLSRSTNVNFNSTFNFTFKAPVSMLALRSALEAAVQRHSMLRVRFSIDEAGQWTQMITNDIKGSYRLESSKARNNLERDAILERSRTGLDIKNGPLLRADVVEMPNGKRSFHVVLHHMATDRVSWSLLLSDIEKHVTTGSLPEEPPFSYQVWSELQAKDAIDNWPPQKALPFNVPDADFKFWGMAGRRNTVQQAMTHYIRLPADLISLARSHTGLEDLEVSDMLTVALSSSFRECFPEREPPTIFNQGHGREAYHPDIDLSQSLGWFTTYWPIHVSPQPEESSTALLQRTIRLRQSLPHSGRAYFASRYHHPEGINAFASHNNMEVYLNYLGDFRKHLDDNSILEMMDKLDSGLHGEEEDVKRLALFTVNALVEDDGFRIAFACNENTRHLNRIIKWGRGFEIRLLELAGLSVERPSMLRMLGARAKMLSRMKSSAQLREESTEHSSLSSSSDDTLVISTAQPPPAAVAVPINGLRMKLLSRMRSSAMIRSAKVGRGYGIV